MSQRLIPLNKKIRKGGDLLWNQEDLDTVKAITTEIKKGVALTIPDTTADFVLKVDASDVEIGAKLKQKHGIVGIFSKALTWAETRDSVTERKMLAILRGLQNFHKIIFSSKILVHRDHANLLYDESGISKRISRWKVMLLEYNYKLKHIPGENNIAVDYLSRIGVIGVLKKTPLSLENICKHQKEGQKTGIKRILGKDVYCNDKRAGINTKIVRDQRN